MIHVPGLGDKCAETLCLEAKIASQHDAEKLKAAKDTAYLKGFNEGVMTVGPHKGTKAGSDLASHPCPSYKPSASKHKAHGSLPSECLMMTRVRCRGGPCYQCHQLHVDIASQTAAVQPASIMRSGLNAATASAVDDQLRTDQG